MAYPQIGDRNFPLEVPVRSPNEPSNSFVEKLSLPQLQSQQLKQLQVEIFLS